MKNILEIYKKDIKDIFTNHAMLIVVLALCALPSLYAWFNIKASWDPYGSTSNISVAVVNNDTGTKLRNKNINVGDELIEKLKDNNDLGWKFVNKDDAIKGVQDGTYYASIEIPSNFSKDLTSLVSSNVKKGEIIYTVNEKINAIAPKITDKGASTIQLQVNQTVVETVSEILFETFNEIGIEIEKQIPKLSDIENILIDVQGKFVDVDKSIDLAANGISKVETLASDLKKDLPLIQETLQNSKSLSSDVKEFLKSSKDSINNIIPIIKNDISLVNDISASIVTISNSLTDAVDKGSDDAINLIDNLSLKLNNLSSVNKSLINFLTKLNNLTPIHPLDTIVEKLNAI
ncbi:MAG: YhgE/Pip domain-containing protein, partial [Paraclostridium sp.]